MKNQIMTVSKKVRFCCFL